MRVLIVKTSSMGDILHSLPALTDAMTALPGIRFDWVVEEGFAQIPGWHPAVDKVILIAIRRWRKHWFSGENRADRAKFYQELHSRHYDCVIDAQGLIKSALLVTRKAYGVKHGMDWRSAREPLACLFYNYRHHASWQLHAVERIRELFAQSLGYNKPEQQGDYAIARHFPTLLSDNSAGYAVFLHATTRDDKHWPETQWRKLLSLMANSGLRVKLPWGAAHEEARAKRLAEGYDFVEVLPRLSLEDVAKVIAGAQFVVSVDTGLSHLTAALGRPNITLYGPTDPGLIGGYGKNQFALRRGTTMAEISPEDVIAALKDELNI